MTEATCSIARLDRSQPPPGYRGVRLELAYIDESGHEVPGTREAKTDAEAVAAAWAHFEARNDPPGVPIEYVAPVDPLIVAVHDGWWVYTTATGGLLCLFRRDDEAAARAAAWAWYWRRVKLVGALEQFCGPAKAADWPWPRCLAWPDGQVAEVDRWLAEGGELPEVLRA